MEIRSDFLLLLGPGRGWSESCTEASDNMFIGSTLGRIAVTRARAEAVIAQLDSRLKNSERELRTGAADRDPRTAALRYPLLRAPRAHNLDALDLAEICP